MNWLDFILIAILAIGLAVGLKVGILSALYFTGLVFIGWFAAVQLGSLVGSFFELFLDDDRIVTVVSFCVIMAVVVYFGGRLWTVIRTALGIGTLGASNVIDRLGGLAVGLILGVAVSGAVLVALMRLVDAPDARLDNFRADLENALVESTIVPIYLRGAEALPTYSLGLVPGDFQNSLEYVKNRIG